MAEAAQGDESELDDDRSEASGFSGDDEMEKRSSFGGDSGAVASGDGVVSGGDAGQSGSRSDAGNSDADADTNTQGAAATASREESSGAAPAEPLGPFKTAGKGAAIAKAFAKAARGARDESGTTMLSGSRSVLKRQREEEASEAGDKKARLLRQEMRRRGHIKVSRRGEDPDADAVEKALLRTARRGVVRLFNAVAKAQKQASEQQAPGSRAKDKQLTKASFLAELRGKSAAAAEQKQRPGAAAAGAAGLAPSEQAAASDKPAWEALQDDFSSLQSGLRMKDWDKREAVTEAPVVGETMADLGSDSDDD